MDKSVFDEIDFDTMYKTQKALCSYKTKSSFEWDNKAEGMNVKSVEGIYNDFIKSKISFKGVKSFLDVGCGTGAFALSFAPFVENVFAFDFSDKMLEKLRENIAIHSVKNIKYIKRDIEGDWEGIPICDVALASRCFEVNELKNSLEKLNAHAKKAVYMSVKVGKSFLSDELLSVIGREIAPRPDYIYVVNTLYQMGIKAQVEFVPKEDEKRCISSQNIDDYIKSITWSLDGITQQEELNIRKYFAKCKKSGKNPAFRNNAWALIYWEK
jgi:SAM-dependent methyltransferase